MLDKNKNAHDRKYAVKTKVRLAAYCWRTVAVRFIPYTIRRLLHIPYDKDIHINYKK